MRDHRRAALLPRLQLFELEDLPWFPSLIRDLATDYLHFMEKRFALHKPMVPLLLAALKQSGVNRVVDLCSGGGGPILDIAEALAAEGMQVHFTLTDRYPNLTAFTRLAKLHPGAIDYVADSINATSVPRELHGLRTMFNAFHHFSPSGAHSVLACAVEAGQPIAIFEIPERALRNVIPLLFTPIFMALATPFIRPFRWQRLLWTYLLPLVPLTAWWDGVVSQFRAYTVTEMLNLAQGFKAYQWTADRVAIGNTPGNVTYLVGIPKP